MPPCIRKRLDGSVQPKSSRQGLRERKLLEHHEAELCSPSQRFGPTSAGAASASLGRRFEELRSFAEELDRKVDLAGAHALGIAEGCAATASCPRIRNHHYHTNSVRIASSLRADMIFGKATQKKVLNFKPAW